MPKQTVSAPVVAFYDLCPNDPQVAAYFALRPKEQVRVMHQLLLGITRAIGGGSLAVGKALMKRWQDPTQMKVDVPLVNGHPFLTEAVAERYLADRVEEVDATYPQQVSIESADRAPCPNCVPMPPLHLSVRGTFLDSNGAPLAVSVPTPKGPVRARIGVRMTVQTAFDPPVDDPQDGHDHASGEAHDHGGSAEPVRELKPTRRPRGRAPLLRRKRRRQPK